MVMVKSKKEVKMQASELKVQASVGKAKRGKSSQIDAKKASTIQWPATRSKRALATELENVNKKAKYW